MKYLYSLVMDPANSSVLYAGGLSIFKTTDAGASWIEVTNGLDSASCFSLAISTAPSTLVAATNKGLYKSTNGGATWSGPSQPLFDTLVAIDPRNASNILLVSNDILRSTDGGSTFTPSASGLIAAPTSSIAVDPRNDSVIYTSGDAGIFRSTDYGESWSLLLAELTQSIAIDPFNSQALYAITSGTFRRSLNGGVVWEDFSTGLPSQVERGLPTATHIRLDPFTPGTLYTTNLGAPYKKMAAADWTIKNNGLPAGPFASFLEIDPRNGSVLYTGGTFGLYKTTDGAESWRSSSTGLPKSGVASLRIDPFDSNHLLSWKSAAYESTNAGATWAPFAAPSGRPLGVLTFDPTTRGGIYNNSDGVVERSNDGGRTWVTISGPAFDHGSILVISPSGNWLYSGDSDGGVWVFHISRRSRAVRH